MALSMSYQPFSLGAVVIPAQNGILQGLGYDVSALGDRALGSVTETRPKKVYVKFPELNLSLWISHDELADVEFESLNGNHTYQKLIPEFSLAVKKKISLAWWIWKLAKMLPVTHVLHTESGQLKDLWSEDFEVLKSYYTGSIEEKVSYLGLGISELILAKWLEVEKTLGDELLFARFLPAGMHKIEVGLFLRS